MNSRCNTAIGIGLVLMGCLLAMPALAWGMEGHTIIADIAEAHLTPAARARVTTILGGKRMREVAYFADEYRMLHPETARWHFVNIADDAEDYQAERDCKPVSGQGDCIVAAIARNLEDLRFDGERQAIGLKFLIHFVGDIHQPFHAIKEARGGNDIKVTFLGIATNLHRLWDSDLIWNSREPPEARANRLAANLRDRSIDVGTNADVVAWALASRAIGLTALVPPNDVLGEEYAREFIPVVDAQLSVAGIRLARLLNDAFK